MTRWLLDKGADVTAKDGQDGDAVRHTALEKLIQENLDHNKNNDAMQTAEWLVDYGAECQAGDASPLLLDLKSCVKAYQNSAPTRSDRRWALKHMTTPAAIGMIGGFFLGLFVGVALASLTGIGAVGMIGFVGTMAMGFLSGGLGGLIGGALKFSSREAGEIKNIESLAYFKEAERQWDKIFQKVPDKDPLDEDDTKRSLWRQGVDDNGLSETPKTRALFFRNVWAQHKNILQSTPDFKGNILEDISLAVTATKLSNRIVKTKNNPQ